MTGAAQGIGRRVAEVLGGEGCALVLCDLREPAETLEALGAPGVDAVEVVGDIAEEAAAMAAATAIERSGRSTCWSTTRA